MICLSQVSHTLYCCHIRTALSQTTVNLIAARHCDKPADGILRSYGVVLERNRDKRHMRGLCTTLSGKPYSM